MNISIPSYGASAPQYDPAQMKAERQQKLDQLKQIDPALADKMQKIDAAMQQARSSGTDRETAMKSIKSQFGELSSKEQDELKQVGIGGQRPHVHGGRPSGPPPSAPPSGTDADGDNDGDKASSDASGASNDAVAAAFKNLMAELGKKYGATASASSTSSSQGVLA